MVAESQASRRWPYPVIFLALAAFLIPFIGGQLPTDAWPLEPGYAPTVRSLFRGVEIATLQHAFLALLVVAAFAYLVIKRKIVQVPHIWVTAPLAALIALLISSVFMSNYRWVSITSTCEWVAYALALVAGVAGLGRKNGPIAVLSALSAGCGLVALMGIFEYGSARSGGDPSWRIFGGWNNPNALAGIMVIGTLVGMGLLASSIRTKAVGLAVFGGIAASLCGIALVLTGSKGGFLSLGVGFLVLSVLLLAWRKPVAILAILGCLLVIGSPILLLKSSGAGGGLRVVSGADTQEQSAGFRLQLWKGAMDLVKESPVGHGMNTYSFYSSKPGTNTVTLLAHSTWLQLAVDAGVLAPVALLVMLLGWLAHTFRGARNLPTDQNVLRAAVIAAVFATAVDGMIESNLYFFGTGLALFLLLAVGIQLSADAGAPEFVAPPMRIAAVLVGLGCAGQLMLAGYIGKMQSNVTWAIQTKQVDDAREMAASLRGIAPFDGDTWYRSGDLATSRDEQLRDYALAAEIAPSPKYYRRLARAQIEANKAEDAVTSLRHALDLDPNNMSSLLLMMQTQDKIGQTDDAVSTAKKLIDIESTPLFKIRALPQLVPTETYEARLYLATKESDKEKLLRAAVEGFLEYARTTLPYAHTMAQGGDNTIGVSLSQAQEETNLGLQAAKDLQKLYLGAGDKVGAEWAGKAVSEFEVAIAGNK